MIEHNSDLVSDIKRVAGNAVHRYAQGLLSTEWLEEQILKEWKSIRVGEDQPPRGLLIRIAQRICSRTLYTAWSSPEEEQRECAFANLRCYLEFSLRHSCYAPLLSQYISAIDDILNQALVELHHILVRDSSAESDFVIGPKDPDAFLKWTQTIVIRQAYTFFQKCQREQQNISLEEQPEGFTEQFVDSNNTDPQEQIMQKELQQALKNAILSLKNPYYREVLIYTYLVGISESELATRLGVRVQDIYMWRHRALKALRSKPEVEQALRPWLR